MKDGVKEKKKAAAVIIGMVTALLILAGIFIGALVRWGFSVWKNLNANEILYHLLSPLKGTGDGLITRFVLNCIVPAFLITTAYVLAYIFLKGRKRRILSVTVTALALVIGIVSSVYTWHRLKLGDYLKSQLDDSTFIADNYVDPKDVSLTFPEKKRNLIYIYLESMEMTYADKEHGGAFERNVIPELTELALKNEDFGDHKHLNGGFVLPCTDFTMGGIFAATCGLPLKLSVSDTEAIEGLNSFFPSMTNLGDILEKENYNQVFFIGSDASFGGRKEYFEEHGGYEIDDYYYALKREWIPNSYKASSWGYEDEKLFEFARIRLGELAAEDRPFNFTMLTVDTHFEDGNPCRLCRNDFDDQYSNVFACSSRQVTAFVDWIKEQDFYEDTTIVLSGDHLTMDSDYCDNVPEDYPRRTYSVYINPSAERRDNKEERVFSTLDNFPTTLAAMGVGIEGDRLGLGVNLFSESGTLLEKNGFETVSEEINKRSGFMERLSDYAALSDGFSVAGAINAKMEVQYYDPEAGILRINLLDIRNFDEEIEKVSYQCFDNDSPKNVKTGDFEARDDNESFTGKVDLSGADPWNSTVNIYIQARSGEQYLIKTLTPEPVLYNFDIYLDWLKTLKESGDYVIFISARDDMSESLEDESVTRLRALGLEADFKNAYRKSYLAVIEGEKVDEEISDEMLVKKGVTPDGKKYGLGSAGYETGNTSSVMIDGEEYSVNKTGFNIVVYSVKTGEVINSTEFNTNFGYYVSKDRMVFGHGQ